MKKIKHSYDASQAKSALYELAREGARKMIEIALIEEQDVFLKKYSHLLTRSDSKRLVKNGFHQKRNLQLAVGEVTVKVPRVRDRQGEIYFQSSIVPKYLRRSKEIDEFICKNQ